MTVYVIVDFLIKSQTSELIWLGGGHSTTTSLLMVETLSLLHDLIVVTSLQLSSIWIKSNSMIINFVKGISPLLWLLRSVFWDN